MPLTSRGCGKRNYPEHNNSYLADTGESKMQELEDSDTDEYVCDRCTDSVEDLIQCKRCEMWLCSKCETVPPEVIGKHSELRVH